MKKPYNIESLRKAHAESERGWSGFGHVIPDLIEEIERLREENRGLMAVIKNLWDTTNA